MSSTLPHGDATRRTLVPADILINPPMAARPAAPGIGSQVPLDVDPPYARTRLGT